MSLKDPVDLSEKLHARVTELVPLEPGEQILLLYDDTALASAKSGLVLTERRLVKYDKREATVARLVDVTTIALRRERGNTMLHALAITGTAGTPSFEQPMYLDEGDARRLMAVIQGYARSGLEINDTVTNALPRAVNRGTGGFLLSTTPTIEGRPVEAYLGIVSAEVVFGANIGLDLVAGITDLLGGRSQVYESEFSSAREAAFRILEKSAVDLGANAVVGIDVDYEVVGAKGSMLMVSVNGTAVRLP